MSTVVKITVLIVLCAVTSISQISHAELISLGLADRAKVIQELHRHAKVALIGEFAASMVPDLSYEMAESLVGTQITRVGKIRVGIFIPLKTASDVMDTRNYDRDYGLGAAEKIVARLRFGDKPLAEAIAEAINDETQVNLSDGTTMPKNLFEIGSAQIRRLIVSSRRDDENMLDHLVRKARQGTTYNVNGNYRRRMQSEGLLDFSGEVLGYLRNVINELEVFGMCDSLLKQNGKSKSKTRIPFSGFPDPKKHTTEEIRAWMRGDV